MKTAGLLKMTFCILSVTHLLLYAAPQWNLIGLKEQNVNCLLFDYLLDGGSNLLAGADDGLYFYWPDDTNWLKYGEFPSLPVNDIKCAYRGRIVAVCGNYGGSWSDGAYFGDELLDGPPFYVFKVVDYFPCAQSLVIKGDKGDTVFVGGINKISMSVRKDSTYELFEKLKTPSLCFGSSTTAKCAALQLFGGDELVAGGYDQDTVSPKQGHLLWQRAKDSMHVFGELNVSALSTAESPSGDLYIGTTDDGIYYYSGVMSSPPIKCVPSPNNEPVNDLIIIPGEEKAEVILCAAVASGVYTITITDSDTAQKKLGDLPAEPNCLALLNKLTSDGVLYAGTTKGVYAFDTSNVHINGVPVQENSIENLKIRNIHSGSVLIDFSIEKAGKLSVDILDLAGRIVASFNNADYTAGRHMLPWDVESGYSSGLYIIRLSADEKRICKKFMLLRR